MVSLQSYKISIIIPTYNRENFIVECLDSVVNQTYSNWEALVVDDGSTDRTKEIVVRYAEGDERIKLIERNREPKGASTCRNIGVSVAEGEFLIFLDSDDLLTMHCLKQRITEFIRQPEADFIVYPTRLFKHQVGDMSLYWNKPISDRDDLTRFMDFDTPWQTSGPIWKKKSFEQLSGFDEGAQSAQDWELHVRALIKRLNYIIIEDLRKADVYHRRHETSISSTWLEKSKILNRVNLLIRIYYEIINRVSVTREIKKSYAGIFFRQSLQLLKINEGSLAIQVYENVKYLELLPKYEFIFWLNYVITQKFLCKNKALQNFSVKVFDSLAYRLLGYQYNSSVHKYFLRYYWVDK